MNFCFNLVVLSLSCQYGHPVFAFDFEHILLPV